MQNFDQKAILITGASSGIGRELALQLASPDCRIWLIGRNLERLNEVAEEVRKRGGDARPFQLDLSDFDAVKLFMEKEFRPEVRVDCVYLAAAITGFGEIKDMLREDWERIYRTNLLSPVQMTCHFYRGMVERKSGKIVLVSSLAAYSGYPIAVPYATMKAGLLGLYRSLWYEGKVHGVSIFHVAPGYVETEIYRSAIFRKTNYENTMKQIGKLGFKPMRSADAARSIIRGVKRGKREFAFPAYASVLKWMSSRFPFVITLVHRRMVKLFHRFS